MLLSFGLMWISIKKSRKFDVLYLYENQSKIRSRDFRLHPFEFQCLTRTVQIRIRGTITLFSDLR